MFCYRSIEIACTHHSARTATIFPPHITTLDSRSHDCIWAELKDRWMSQVYNSGRKVDQVREAKQITRDMVHVVLKAWRSGNRAMEDLQYFSDEKTVFTSICTGAWEST